MSTAGKVLCVLILLASLAWVVLGAGVDQLSRNGNAALDKAAKDYAKAQDALAQAKADMVQFKDQTTVVQEAGDQQLAVLLSRKNDVERASSTIKDVLNKIQFQLETAQATIKHAETARERRLAEKADETKALADLRAEVDGLMARDAELAERLDLLRKEFKDVFSSNVEMVASSKR
jgi:chromosome segregation ATPase